MPTSGILSTFDAILVIRLEWELAEYYQAVYPTCQLAAHGSALVRAQGSVLVVLDICSRSEAIGIK